MNIAHRTAVLNVHYDVLTREIFAALVDPSTLTRWQIYFPEPAHGNESRKLVGCTDDTDRTQPNGDDYRKVGSKLHWTFHVKTGDRRMWGSR